MCSGRRGRKISYNNIKIKSSVQDRKEEIVIKRRISTIYGIYIVQISTLYCGIAKFCDSLFLFCSKNTVACITKPRADISIFIEAAV